MPHPQDQYAIPGGVSSAKTQDEAIINVVKVGDTLADRVKSLMSFHLNSLYNTNEEPKYMVSSDQYYLAGGSLTVDPEKGRMELTKRINDKSPAFLDVNQDRSRLKSEANRTTVGSTIIDTIDGYIMNPLAKVMPSTSFSPKKGWVKQMFPGFDTESMTLMLILELVQGAVLSGLGSLFANNSVTNTEVKKSEKDLGTIIIENSDTFIANGNI